MSPVQIRLRELRAARGLTQVQLAELCGMPQSTISRIESGSTTGVDFETLDKIAAAIGVHPSELIAYDRIPFEFQDVAFVIVDRTADTDELPSGATAMWEIEGQGIRFPSGPTEMPPQVIAKARRCLSEQRAVE